MVPRLFIYFIIFIATDDSFLAFNFSKYFEILKNVCESFKYSGVRTKIKNYLKPFYPDFQIIFFH